MLTRSILFSTAFIFSSALIGASLADIKMPDNGLSFREVEGYQDYKVVATHYRSDKKELRYIMANPIAIEALMAKKQPLPEGSKIVKVAWSIKPMTTFPDALEADQIQRVEYMLKDSKHYNQNGDHWGYARYVKKGDEYVPYAKGAAECIACHASVASDDYLFTSFQKTY